MIARAVRHRSAAALLLAVVMLTAASCGDDASSTPTSPTATSPVTETFTGQFIPGGSAARAFTAASAGTVSLTLAQLGPPADLVVGFGVGIPQSNGSGCYMTRSVNTGAASSPQITVAVDAGAYCVRLYDLGTMKAATSFTVTIVRP